jgi:hypothetical protein
MEVWLVFTILLYVLGMVPTYVVFDETTSQPKFNKIWFTLVWPTVAILQLGNWIINGIKSLNKK